MKFLVRCLLLTTVTTILTLTTVLITANISGSEEYHPSNPKSYSNVSQTTWFVHLTDLHISAFQDQTRITDLIQFCQFMKEQVEPIAVVVSGDITCAKDRENPHLTHQIEEEWKSYDQVLKSCDFSFPWLDLRGNHDVFDVSSDTSNENRFRFYSEHGSKRSYLKKIQSNGFDLSFIALDFSPSPGFRQPLNFMGYLSKNETRVINELIDKSKDSHHTIFFGHYPTSFVETDDWISVSEFLRSGTVYLCGHLHTLFQKVYNMYSRHSSGLVELELGDWKMERIFRIFAFEKNEKRFSFQDFVFKPNANNTFIVILTPQKSKVEALIFSNSEISKVVVNDKIEMLRDEKSKQIYRAISDNEDFETVKVAVMLKSGEIVTQTFNDKTLDSVLNFFILRLNWGIIFQLSFYFLSFGILVVLAFFRILHIRSIKTANRRKLRYTKLKASSSKCCNCLNQLIIRKLWMLSYTNETFWPLVSFLIYFMFFPWTFAYVLNEKLGLIFSWGVITFEPLMFNLGNMNYFYGFFVLLFYFVPLIVILAFAIDVKFSSLQKPLETNIVNLLKHIPLLVLLIIQVRHAVIQYLTYGLVCLISPFSIGLPIMSLMLYKNVLRLDSDHFFEIKKIWN